MFVEISLWAMDMFLLPEGRFIQILESQQCLNKKSNIFKFGRKIRTFSLIGFGTWKLDIVIVEFTHLKDHTQVRCRSLPCLLLWRIFGMCRLFFQPLYVKYMSNFVFLLRLYLPPTKLYRIRRTRHVLHTVYQSANWLVQQSICIQSNVYVYLHAAF